MKDIIAKVGVPDGFAAQYFVTQFEGVPTKHVKAGPEAGTYHYLLHGGGEVFILVSDNKTINLILRLEKSGVCHEVYHR